MKVMNFRSDLSSTPRIQSDLLFHKHHTLVFIVNTLWWFPAGETNLKLQGQYSQHADSELGQESTARARLPSGASPTPQLSTARECPHPSSLLRKAISMLKDAPSLMVALRKNSTVSAVLDEVEVHPLPTTISGSAWISSCSQQSRL